MKALLYIAALVALVSANRLVDTQCVAGQPLGLRHSPLGKMLALALTYRGEVEFHSGEVGTSREVSGTKLGRKLEWLAGETMLCDHDHDEEGGRGEAEHLARETTRRRVEWLAREAYLLNPCGDNAYAVLSTVLGASRSPEMKRLVGMNDPWTGKPLQVKMWQKELFQLSQEAERAASLSNPFELIAVARTKLSLWARLRVPRREAGLPPDSGLPELRDDLLLWTKLSHAAWVALQKSGGDFGLASLEDYANDVRMIGGVVSGQIGAPPPPAEH